MENLDKFKTLIFDCDGVILNSNKLKTNAFFQTTLGINEESALELVEYHLQNGGISRNKKFEFYLTEILPKYSKIELNIETLLNSYSEFLEKNLENCEMIDCLSKLKDRFNKQNRLLVSGGNQKELRILFNKKGISSFFSNGIFGSPDSKEIIIQREIDLLNIIYPAIYFGDSKYDFEVSRKYDIEFVFVSNWTDMRYWQEFVNKNQLKSIDTLCDLL
ncbi:HAD family hydrolase [Prochlorococcus sp. AH-716-M06]|nr:HAD family hydrolase [Prochlorococcus sp. AH-716-M06]